MYCERRLLTTLIARDVTDPRPVPIRVLDSSLLMRGTFTQHRPGLPDTQLCPNKCAIRARSDDPDDLEGIVGIV